MLAKIAIPEFVGKIGKNHNTRQNLLTKITIPEFKVKIAIPEFVGKNHNTRQNLLAKITIPII